MPSPASQLADRVVVVLVQPQHSGNVGSAARAMKNMGLRRLVVLDPPALDLERARWMSPGCRDILREMRIVATMEQALEGCHRAVAATARHRKSTQPIWEPREVARRVLDDPADQVTAILFGREDHGLSREQVDRCTAILRIPTPEHASLNLAQAVMLVSHVLFDEARARGAVASGRSIGGRRRSRSTRALDRPDARARTAELGELEPAVQELVSLLERVGYTRSADPRKVALSARQGLQSASPSLRQVDALRGMVARIQWALDHPELDWRATRKRRSPDQG